MFCGHCGQLNADGLRFCTSCGADLAGQTPAGTPTGRTPSSDMSGGQTLISPNAGTPAGITISGGQTLASPTPSTPGWDMDAGASSLGLRHGDVVADRFEVVALLGQGGMGAVFKVQDTELDQVRAMKVIRPEIIQRPDMQERFRNEVKLCQQLNHSGIVRIYDYGRDRRRDLSFYTMEFIDGQTLRLWLSQKVRGGSIVTLGEFKIIAQGICEPLIEAHKVTIHRDLKPENVMIERATKRFKLMDFGIAKVLDASGRSSSSVSLLGGGTPHYVAPEQERGEKAGQRADIYSLGVMFYEVLAGEVPRAGCRPITFFRSDMPTHVAEAIMKAMSVSSIDRFVTVDAFFQSLSMSENSDAVELSRSEKNENDSIQLLDPAPAKKDKTTSHDALTKNSQASSQTSFKNDQTTQFTLRGSLSKRVEPLNVSFGQPLKFEIGKPIKQGNEDKI